jgi:hypothetical protein
VDAEEGGEGLLVRLVLAGGGFLGLIEELEVLEEDLAELLGGGDVEGGAGVGFDGFRELVDALLEIDADILKGSGVDGDAFHFHADEDGEERGFDFGKDGFHAAPGEDGAELCGELEGDIGVFGGVFGQGFQGDGKHVQILGLGGLLFSEGEEVVGLIDD